MLKAALKRLLEGQGYHIYQKDVMPRGVEIHRDLQRLTDVTKASMVFDVGAHEGETAEKFAEIFPRAQVHGFEPISASFEVARGRQSRHSRLEFHHAAVGAEPGQVRVFLQSDSFTNSLKSEINRAENAAEARFEDVQVVTLDAFATERSIQQIDFLKIDTEGFELQVLQGAKGLLERGAIRFLLAEVGFRSTDERHTSFQALADMLAPHGLLFYSLYELYHYEHPAELLFANALFVHRPSYDRERGR